MKPVLLELAGLQSYREKQVVDFERLCEGGVFGIFGPTGSGKSSILDAMTLALYGRVERAAKGTQGIMNGAENKLSVSLTFEMSGGGEQLRYRVERQYKRAGEVAVHGAVCRLIELTPAGERVLADKQSDVDGAIEGIIGLTMTDFTRAVVLPQGKFAEFLTLAGKDRRQMLQRLFRLERYGDVLSARLSTRSDRVKGSLRETEAEQLGLGDASPASIAAGELRLTAAREAAAALRQRLTAAGTVHEALSRRREREEELQRVERQWEALLAEAPLIAEQEALAERLEQAARALPAVRAADEAKVELAMRSKEREGAVAAAASQEALAEAAEARWQAAQAELAEREPLLIQQLERMEQALRLEAEVERLTSQWTEASQALAKVETGMQASEQQAAKSADLLRQAREKQQKLRGEWERLQPLAEASSMLQQAAGRKQQVDAAIRSAAEAASEAASQLDKHRLSMARFTQAQTIWREIAAQGFRMKGSWAEAAQQLTEWEARFLTNSNAASEAGDREAAAAAAAHLAVELRPGEPCLVCGSLSHPSPAAPSGQDAVQSADIADWAALAREWEQLRREVQEERGRVEWQARRLKAQLAQAGNVSMPSVPVGDSTWQGEAAATREQVVWPQNLEAAQEPFTNLEDGYQQLLRAKQGWSSLRGQVKSDIDHQEAWDEAFSAANRELGLAEEAAVSADEAYRVANAKQIRLAEIQEDALREWSQAYPEISIDKVEQDAQRAGEAELSARDLRKRLDLSVTFIEEQEQLQQSQERERHEAALHKAEWKTRSERIHSELESRVRQLQTWTSGEPAARLKEQAQQQRVSLQETTKLAKASQESTNRARSQAEAARSAAQERELAAIEGRERTLFRQSEVLAASGFTSADAVNVLASRIGEAGALLERTRAYRRNEQQLTGQVALLRGQSAEEPLSSEVWNESVMAMNSLHQQFEEAATAAAKAERDAEDLSARRGRWEVLEARRTELTEEHGRIAQLQAVFRGNAFVEYVAEEQLEQVCRTASERLGFLTRRRYALEVDAGGGFVIRDDANGGIRRPVSTLSGGETFLTSLALALALSAQIQLRGRYPLQFFFLDEGFGTLDQELLETVVTSLEKLQKDELAVGVISHVPELQARLPRRLLVAPAEPGGRGSRITF